MRSRDSKSPVDESREAIKITAPGLFYYVG